ncbi:dTDP-glucose 4,6-dehydratase [Thermosipho melanesiensis]|uniref:dTDP-glucose 4,6-dehydratase n=3 Tax=Thermosipho melanesiensis TaxID=46541 RepID=A6LKC8_THEM4|nr:dTDP-glucose 4,6-dehydratase [Thermosipho melanesiensis]ABR30379.1 dTDP-glucose 4,6-dehydratase [Thermosipho melanesiensis BI429]APT73541.1 dTDP-glucose 4,6-dehydratase [Thermosipho melanesiensis]
MTLLVTGCAGFIGSNFVYYYLEKYKDRKIVGLDKLTYAGNLENLGKLTVEQRKRFKFIKGDINNKELLEYIFEEYEIDGVINFAAESHVDRSIYDPQIFLKTNILGTQTLLDVAKKYWYRDGKWKEGKKFLQVSTDEVYGSLGPTGYFTEKTPLDPHSPYSASKASADLIVKAYHDTYKMPINITRCSNNYGPYQFPEKLIPLMIWNTLNHKELPVYGDGRQIRDWLYVKDHCRAIDMVYEKGKVGEVYNIGGHNEKENIYIVKKIIEILRKKTGDKEINEGLIRHVKDRPGHDRRYGIDPTKIKEELGWEPEIMFDEGIELTIEWYLENIDWMKKVIK